MSLRQTGFHSRAASAGAVFDEYAGYELPYRFGDDILPEYYACRQRAAVIDLSPLRKIDVGGPDAERLLQAVVTRDLDLLSDGQIVYTALCDAEGNVIDDGTVFRFGPDRFRWVGYQDEDEEWFRSHADRLGLHVTLENSTDRLHNIAVQGPRSREIVSGLIEPAAGRPGGADLSWFRFTEGALGGRGGPDVLLSRTGYSGELGYEIWCQPDDGSAVWDAVFEAGGPVGVGPLGLDALDLLRVEAGLVFKGYEYDGTQTPAEAGIGFVVTPGKRDDFVGKAAIERRQHSAAQVFVGLDVEADEPAAGGDRVLDGDDGSVVGVITSGVLSPILERNIAFARVDASSAAPGTKLVAERAEGGGGNDRVSATATTVPFYDPDKSRVRA
jgi:aminomethyltransferase